MAKKYTRQDLRDAAEKYKNWGKWGPNDEIGTLNYTSAEDIVAATRLVKKGKVISLALNFDYNGPQGAKSKYPAMGRINPVHTMLDTGTDAAAGTQGFPHGLGGADDVIAMPLQCSTQWDGLGHIFDHGVAWNGRPAGSVVTSDGDLVTGIEHAASAITGRGVLLDVGRHLRPEASEDGPAGVLPDGYAITTADLEACIADRRRRLP